MSKHGLTGLSMLTLPMPPMQLPCGASIAKATDFHESRVRAWAAKPSTIFATKHMIVAQPSACGQIRPPLRVHLGNTMGSANVNSNKLHL